IFFFLNRLFPEGIALIIAFGSIIILSIIFSQRLKIFYNRIEKRFLQNLNAREDGKPQSHVAEHLPWDTHIAEFEVQAESELAGKKLMDLELREKFGINIARIERGRVKINVPSRDKRLFPHDVISVIGTDEELDKFRHKYFVTAANEIDEEHYNEVTLHQFKIEKHSTLVGKTIQESIIHQNMLGLVIGIERGSDRILNPKSTVTFHPGDLVWIAGEDNILSKINKVEDHTK
ncbi:MAG: TrkA C-terminal domain-containing protein, partial [Ignavibacteria bacterium]